jgi:hypothetical protein
MLGDFNAFCASFLTLGDVIAAGALAIPQVYVAKPWFIDHKRQRNPSVHRGDVPVQDWTSLTICGRRFPVLEVTDIDRR